jgi:hypothetical protein
VSLKTMHVPSMNLQHFYPKLLGKKLTLSFQYADLFMLV